MNILVLAVVFCQQFQKTNNLRQNFHFFKICWQNTTASMETFTEKELGHNFAQWFSTNQSSQLDI